MEKSTVIPDYVVIEPDVCGEGNQKIGDEIYRTVRNI